MNGALMSQAKSKRWLLASGQRERGIDNDAEHHLVLYRLRLLDDDDDYELFLEMRLEEDELNLTPSAQQWEDRLRRLAMPTDVPTSPPAPTRRRGKNR